MQLFYFIKYLLTAVNEHGIHPPFLFNLYTKVIKQKAASSLNKSIESIRKEYVNTNQSIEIIDLGAGSKINKGKLRNINQIVRHSVSLAEKSSLQFRLIQHFNPNYIIELGTSLGINTAYMATANPKAEVYTLEGSPSLVKIATQTFEKLNIKNIKVIEGNFDTTLPELLLTNNKKIDFVYLDGNHTYEATIRYFNLLLPYINEDTILIVDDIHWSKEMNNAWKEIYNYLEVTLSLDLYSLGIIFFKKTLTKQHFILRF